MIIVLGTASPAFAADATEAAKQSQNPVAKVINMPIQSNVNFGGASGTQWVNLVQPVIPQHGFQAELDTQNHHSSSRVSAGI